MITGMDVEVRINNRDVLANEEFGPVTVDIHTITLRGRRLRNFIQFVVGPRNREQVQTTAVGYRATVHGRTDPAYGPWQA